MFLDSFTVLRLTQYAKTPFPISETELGTLMCFRPLHPKKTLSPNIYNDLEKITVLKLIHFSNVLELIEIKGLEPGDIVS